MTDSKGAGGGGGGNRGDSASEAESKAQAGSQSVQERAARRRRGKPDPIRVETADGRQYAFHGTAEAARKRWPGCTIVGPEVA